MSVLNKDTFSNLIDKITTNTPNYTVDSDADVTNIQDADRFGEGSRQTAYNDVKKAVADDRNDLMPPEFRKGSSSLINEHAIITVGRSGERYKDEGPNLWFDDGNLIAPSAKNLIQKWNQENDFAPYKIEDFLYAKYYGLIPNNHLITLRRFYRPTFDNMQVHVREGDPNITKKGANGFREIQYPIATAVTWFGNETDNNLADLLNFTCGFEWSTIKADVEDVKGPGAGFQGGLMGGLFRAIALGTGDPEASRGEYLDTLRNHDFYKAGPYQNRVYGPINVIYETLKRDRGLNFNQEFKVKFHYNLRSIDSNNPKLVMIDIMSNFLSLCFNFGEFWGGAYRYWPALVKSPIPGGLGTISQLYSGDADQILAASRAMTKQMVTSVGNRVSGLGDALRDLVSGNFKGALDRILSGAQSTGLIQGLLSGLSMGDMTNALAIPPLLTGDPMGEWHMTVGNPFNPTLMAGNLVCEGMDVSFNNEISFEGFPTELTFEVTLKHGRPRDSGDIQSMFNRGNGRTYHYLDDGLNPNQSSSGENTRIDTSPEMARKMGLDDESGSKIRRHGWGPRPETQ